MGNVRAMKKRGIMGTKTLQLRQLNRVIAGLVIIALATMAVQITRIIAIYWQVELGYMAALLGAWIFIYWNLRYIGTGFQVFNRLRIAGMAAIACQVFRILVTVFVTKSHGIEIAYTDFKSLALGYIVLLCGLYLYHQLLRFLRIGAGNVCRDPEKKIPSAMHDGWGCFIIIFACLLAIPIVTLATDQVVQMSLVIVISIIAMIMQIFMCLRMIAYESFLRN